MAKPANAACRSRVDCDSLSCSGNSTTATTIVRPELIAVSPDDFLGRVACGDGPAAARSYVATLFDVTPAADGICPVKNDCRDGVHTGELQWFRAKRVPCDASLSMFGVRASLLPSAPST